MDQCADTPRTRRDEHASRRSRTAPLLLDEARQRLEGQPDATLALARIAASTERIRDIDRVPAAGRFAITTAEPRVLEYLPTNLTLVEIASRLYLSRFTVKSHARSIYRKLGAANRTEAVGLAHEAGLVQADPLRSVWTTPGTS